MSRPLTPGRSNSSWGRGFTLIEMIIFIVVVSIGLAGILLVSNQSVYKSSDPIVNKQMMAIAESLLEEITLKDYFDPSGAGNGYTTCTGSLTVTSNRSQAALSICDYNGYSTSAGITDVTGTAVSQLTAYNIASVTVTLAPAAITNAASIVVTVKGPTNTTFSLTGYRGKY